jgi:hypothetical protein
MADSLSVAYEHRESFRVFYSAATKHLEKNDKIYSAKFKRFKHAIEQTLLQLAADKLNSLFGDAYMNNICIDFEFFTYAPNGNSGGTDFMFDDDPEISFQINFNNNLRELYKKDLRLFCLTLSDIYTHELIHCVQYIKQYQSVGTHEEKLKESLFKHKEYLFKADPRFHSKSEYYEDLPYFSKHEELVCYSKDTARQLLTAYKDKKIVFDKLSNTRTLEELAKESDCFYYYYDCFYKKIPGLDQYEILWRSFIKHLCRNLHEDFAI